MQKLSQLSGILMLAILCPMTGSAATSECDHVSTLLISTTDSQYPDPICSKCKIVTSRSTSSQGDVRVELAIDYHDDDRWTLAADATLVILTADGDRDSFLLENLVLEDGVTNSYNLTELANFDVSTAEFVWVELVERTEP